MASDDLHVRLHDDVWVIHTESGEELARYATQKEAWAFAEVRSRTSRVDAYCWEGDDISGTFLNRRTSLTLRTQLIWAGLAIAVALIVISLAVAIANNEEPNGSDSAQEGTESIAQGLAAIDSGTFVAADDPTASDYQRNLDSLRDEVCQVSEERVADMAVASRRASGSTASLLELLEEANHAAAVAPDAEAVAISLGLPSPSSAEDRCALYLTAAGLKLSP